MFVYIGRSNAILAIFNWKNDLFWFLYWSFQLEKQYRGSIYKTLLLFFLCLESVRTNLLCDSIEQETSLEELNWGVADACQLTKGEVREVRLY